MRRWLMLFSLLLGAAKISVADQGIEAGTILWNADNGQNTALMWGLVARVLPFSDDPPLEARASFIQGTFNQGGDRETQREVLATVGWVSRWGFFSAGWTYHAIATELQRDFVWSYPEEEEERNADLHGPYLGYAMEWPVYRPIDAALSAGWMPYDAGDLRDLDFDGSFYEVAGGLQWLVSRVRAEAGYRYRKYRDLPDRVIDDRTFDRSIQEGWYLSLLFRF